MSTLFQLSTVRDTVADLNALLQSLSIPVVLESPHDLTSSLLIAILESLRRDRLPLPQATRQARDLKSRTEAMNVFLEVLDADFDLADVTLDEVDPQRLATGEWDEVVVVGEALVNAGRALELLPRYRTTNPKSLVANEEDSLLSTYLGDASQDDSSFDVFGPPTRKIRSTPSRSPDRDYERSQESAHSVSRGSITTNVSKIWDSSLPNSLSGPAEEHSSPLTDSPVSSLRSGTTSFNSSLSPRTPRAGSSLASSIPAPRCIHEVQAPEDELCDSFDASMSLTAQPPYECCICLQRKAKSAAKKRAVQYTDWIEPVDDEEEIRSFEADRRTNFGASLSPAKRALSPRYAGLSFSRPSTPRTPTMAGSGRVLTRLNSPTQHTIALMNERAKLLEELAALKASKLR